MTKRLFYEDAYKKEFEAKVVEIDANRVALDQTCFYPEGGGQVGDIGEINALKVVDTVKKGAGLVKVGNQEIPAGGTIFHIFESPPNFSVGDSVKGVLDWNRRYRIMRLHSASHVMEHFLQQVFGGIERLGANVDPKKDRSDYAIKESIDSERLAKVQGLCNEFISQNHGIKTYSSEENENIMVWQCSDIKMFCGGTHVKNTKEIGKIRLKRKTKGAGKERIETFLDE